MNYEKMKALREAAGLDYKQLGDKVFVTMNMIQMIERGQKDPSIKLLERIAEAIGTTAADLLR